MRKWKEEKGEGNMGFFGVVGAIIVAFVIMALF